MKIKKLNGYLVTNVKPSKNLKNAIERPIPNETCMGFQFGISTFRQFIDDANALWNKSSGMHVYKIEFYIQGKYDFSDNLYLYYGDPNTFRLCNYSYIGTLDKLTGDEEC